MRKYIFLVLSISFYIIGLIFFPDYLLGEEVFDPMSRKYILMYLMPVIFLTPPAIFLILFILAQILDSMGILDEKVLIYSLIITMFLIAISLIVIAGYLLQFTTMILTALFLLLHVKEYYKTALL